MKKWWYRLWCHKQFVMWETLIDNARLFWLIWALFILHPLSQAWMLKRISKEHVFISNGNICSFFDYLRLILKIKYTKSSYQPKKSCCLIYQPMTDWHTHCLTENKFYIFLVFSLIAICRSSFLTSFSFSSLFFSRSSYWRPFPIFGCRLDRMIRSRWCC